MLNTDDVKRILGGAFTQAQADILTGVLSELHVGLATSVDMQDLKDVVKALAVAPARTEERLEGVETRMDRVEAALEHLAAAQAGTEEALKKLIESRDETRKQLGGLSHTVGYILENEAYRALPVLLAADRGIEVEGRLNPIEVNIFGRGRRNGREVVVIGKSKS